MYNNGNWTQGRFNTFIKGVLRTGTRKWAPKYECINAAKRGKRVNSKTGRVAEHYECAECHGLFPLKDVAVDHIEPVVPVTGFVSWDDVIHKMYCNSDSLQVLCSPCHKIKSKKESEERKLHKKNNNKEEV